MPWKVTTIRTVSRMAAGSPALRRALVQVLDLAPGFKRRLKHALARADTIASQPPMAGLEAEADDVLLPLQARRALRDLRRARRQLDAARADGARR
jgi:ATP phosphoribosyltransferase regulatory subunit HisZ